MLIYLDHFNTLPDNWTEYTSTSENLEQVPVTIKYGSNRKSTNPDLPQMQNGKKIFGHNCNKKNWVFGLKLVFLPVSQPSQINSIFSIDKPIFYIFMLK